MPPRPERREALSRVVLTIGLLVLAYVVGYLSREYQLPPYGLASSLGAVWTGSAGDPAAASTGPVGRFEPVRSRQQPVDDGVRGQLEALGYLEGYEAAGEERGVTVHVPGAAQTGINLYNSGHGPEAFLMDMEGNVLHRWTFPFAAALPEDPAPEDNDSWRWWRRVHVLPDGGLLAIYENNGLIRLDRDSNLVWARRGGFHHEIVQVEDGSFWVLFQERRMVPALSTEHPIIEDFLVHLSEDGDELRRVSILEAFDRSPFWAQVRNVKRGPRPYGDVYHSNSLEVLDGSDPHPELFGAGKVLISVRNLHAIAVIDLATEQVSWLMTGLWAYQHEPSILPNGNLLLFDNLGHAGRSKIIEVDPITQQVAWSYPGTEENGFFSRTMGTCQRLGNGNTLVTESEAGRAFEVDPLGTIVWEFYNPARAGEHEELIATLFEVLRLPDDFGAGWLPRPDRRPTPAPGGDSTATAKAARDRP